MSEYIVRETGCPGAVKQEIVGDLVRCKDCKYYWKNGKQKSNLEFMEDVLMCLASPRDDAFCSEGERKEDVTND